MTDFSEILGEILNFSLKSCWNDRFLGEILKFLWNHDEMTHFNEILGKILKFLWNHDEMTHFSEKIGEI